MLDDLFASLQKTVDAGPFGKDYVYTPMTDEKYHSMTLDDIIEWADSICSEWNGDLPGRLEDRASCASDIVAKLNEVKELITEMGEL